MVIMAKFRRQVIGRQRQVGKEKRVRVGAITGLADSWKILLLFSRVCVTSGVLAVGRFSSELVDCQAASIAGDDPKPEEVGNSHRLAPTAAEGK
jgi:hypothetical protein